MTDLVGAVAQKTEWERLVPDDNIRDIIENGKSFSIKDFRHILKHFDWQYPDWNRVRVFYRGIDLGGYNSRYANRGAPKRPKTAIAYNALRELFLRTVGVE